MSTLCCTMFAPTRSVFIIVVSLALTVSAAHNEADICRSGETIGNDDFTISCVSMFRRFLIDCKFAESSWSNFPRDNVTLSSAKSTMFKNCKFPRHYSLLKVITGLDKVWSLEFDNSTSTLGRDNLQGFKGTALKFLGDDFIELPYDLLYDTDFTELTIYRLRLSSIPEAFFEKSMNLKSLKISKTDLNRVKPEDFKGLEVLENMWLSDNKIEEIEPETFDKLITLLHLDISHNRLRTLPTGIFRNLIQLQRIDLSENDFLNLPTELLHVKKSRLLWIRLNDNRGNLTTLPEGVFGNLSRLQSIELTNNNLSSIPANMFSGCNSLIDIAINKNNLKSLPSGLFRDLKSLLKLQLSNNLLESLPEKLIQNTKLEELYLNFNRLNNIPPVILRLNNLMVLQLSQNNITHIDDNICKNMRKLQYINLSYNKLTLSKSDESSNFAFGYCLNLKEVDLSYNKISEVSEEWILFGNLKYLNLEGNQITYVATKHFTGLNANAKLKLEHNNITTISAPKLGEDVVTYVHSGIGNQVQYITVYLDNNPVKCDCELLHFFCYYQRMLITEVELYIDIDNCLPPHNSSKTTDIDTSKLQCLVEDACTEACTCKKYFETDVEPYYITYSDGSTDACKNMCTCRDYPTKKVLYVDCSNRNLTSVPMNIKNTRNWSIELNLSGNKFRETPALIQSYLLNVTALDLSSNEISKVSLSVFSKSLRDLKLHNNSITRLDAKVAKYLVEENTLHNLTLHNNKWLCNCHARSVLNVIHKKLTTFQLYDVTCYGSNRRLCTMTIDEVCKNAMVIVITSSLLIALFGLVIGGLAALYYRYQKEIKVWLYTKQWCLWFVTENELDKDKLYDAFISYSHKDEDFVINQIVAKLEKGPKPYKLCLHYRDWLAGEWIPAQIARSVDESRRTIIVLSPNFLQSIWGRMEFRTAHSQALIEGRARVIVIMYGDIGNTENLDPELKAYLSMNTYVKWGDPWFWDKLRYALPHKYEMGYMKHKTSTGCMDKNLMTQLLKNERDGIGKTEIEFQPKSSVSLSEWDSLLN